MGDFTKAIIRGAGSQIGRNMVNGSRRRSYSSSTRNVGRPSKSSLDKALEYSIGGRVNTMIGKQYNLIQEFENHVRNVSSINDYILFGTAFKKVQEKFNDTSRYIDMVGSTPESETQTGQMDDVLNNILKDKVQLMIDNLTTDNIINDNLDNLFNIAKQTEAKVDENKIANLKKLAKSEAVKSKIFNTIAGVLVFGAFFVGMALMVAFVTSK